MQMNGSVAALLMVLMGAQVPSPPAKAPEPEAAQKAGTATGSIKAPVSPSGSATAPYQKLFDVPSLAAAEAQLKIVLQDQAAHMARPAPKVVCGMVVHPADPQVDPKMIVRPPEPGPTFHIKRIPPPACAE
jgi:hypothetical protein